MTVSAPITESYPCGRGMVLASSPRGWHNFQANAQGIAVCTYCGQFPRGEGWTDPEPWTDGTESRSPIKSGNWDVYDPRSRVQYDSERKHCANCDDRKCMSCRLRYVHDVCEDDCPECCS